MQKKLIVILCSVVVALAAAVLGFGVTMSVSDFKIEGTLYSEKAKEDALAVRDRLNDRIGTNLLFVDTEEVKEEFAGLYPYLTVLSVEKQFPDCICIRVEEKLEVYAVSYAGASGDVYCMLDKDGVVLSLNSVNENHVDGKPNVLLSGAEISEPKVGETVSGEALNRALKAAKLLHQRLGGLRSCIVSIEVKAPTSSSKDESLVLYTVEGVTLQMDNPGNLTELKAARLALSYTELSDTNKLFGTLGVYDDAADPNGIICTYTARDGSVSAA